MIYWVVLLLCYCGWQPLRGPQGPCLLVFTPSCGLLPLCAISGRWDQRLPAQVVVCRCWHWVIKVCSFSLECFSYSLAPVLCLCLPLNLSRITTLREASFLDTEKLRQSVEPSPCGQQPWGLTAGHQFCKNPSQSHPDKPCLDSWSSCNRDVKSCLLVVLRCYVCGHIIGWMVFLPNHVHPEPQIVTLFRNRIFSNVIS